ncbi:MAG: hypothetical protein HYU69_02615 [Bacteroidetes bacterium]|nr:hypothetical protein [Bacteroidota bacterium]
MSKAEKRFFKLYTANTSDREVNNYVNLFDAIDNQDKYSEARLIKEEKYIKQLPKLKNYLHELILESLNVYHSKNSVDFKLRSLIGSIEVLYDNVLAPYKTGQIN